MSLVETYIRDARQVIVKALATKDSLTLSTTHLDVELQRFGIIEPDEWLFDQLDWLARMGVITVRAEGSVRVATLTKKGVDHVSGRRKLEGIGRPTLASLGVDLIAESLKNRGE
ncbi:MAG: hypothetical protein QM651_13665 [Rhodoblastus sp.]